MGLQLGVSPFFYMDGEGVGVRRERAPGGRQSVKKRGEWKGKVYFWIKGAAVTRNLT